MFTQSPFFTSTPTKFSSTTSMLISHFSFKTLLHSFTESLFFNFPIYSNHYVPLIAAPVFPNLVCTSHYFSCFPPSPVFTSYYFFWNCWGRSRSAEDILRSSQDILRSAEHLGQIVIGVFFNWCHHEEIRLAKNIAFVGDTDRKTYVCVWTLLVWVIVKHVYMLKHAFDCA